MTAAITWPDGRRFAFTVFDDPDAQTVDVSRAVYGFLADLGFRTTKGTWVVEPPERNSGGDTCESPAWREHCRDLQAEGFEIGYHNGAPGTLPRPDIIRSLDLFRDYFGHDPRSMANHYNGDAIYWGKARLTGVQRAIYSMVSRRSPFFGHVDGHECFWGDICRERIGYCRNFVFREINTLKACPYMPYADPDRAYVRAWYASTEAAKRPSFVRQIAETEQDRLEEEGGACIMYTHFGHGFYEDGRLNPQFRELMTRLAAKGGWFVPVGTLLDYLAQQRGICQLTDATRGSLERAWLAGKLVHGTS